MDQEAFASACAWAAARLGQGGIGTLGEKSLHAALKYYFEPCPDAVESAVLSGADPAGGTAGECQVLPQSGGMRGCAPFSFLGLFMLCRSAFWVTIFFSAFYRYLG